MSIDPATKLEFDLGPGITLRIGKSRITIQFQFPKGTFTDYLATNNKNIPKLDLIYEIVSGTEHGIAIAGWAPAATHRTTF